MLINCGKVHLIADYFVLQCNATIPERQVHPAVFADYLQLLDWTGRAIRSDKHGAIHQTTPPILLRLNSAD